MRDTLVHSRRASFVTVLVLVLLVSPGLLVGLAMAQGSLVPGMTDPAHDRRHGPVEITFTKWVPAFPLMEGITGGDAPGTYVGEVLQRQVSVNPNLRNGIIRLEAIYEVHSGERSFTALIRGGTNAVTGVSILDGVVLAGWRTGAQVHVEFETIPGGTACTPAPAGLTCFKGTINVGREPKN